MMTWSTFPKRLQSALKALCCLARSGKGMQSQDIAQLMDVPGPATAKILQLLVRGKFVTSRRGSKGGFQLARPTDQITMGDVINFFLSIHPVKPEKSSPVMRTLYGCMAPCQKEFAKLSLAEITQQADIKSPKRRTINRL